MSGVGSSAGGNPGQIVKIIQALASLKIGMLLVLLGAFMAIFSLVETALGMKLVANDELRYMLFIAGVVLLAFGGTSMSSSKSEGLEEIRESLQEFGETLERLVREVSPNGGASLRDSMNRLELMAHRMDQRQLALIDDMEKGVFEANIEGQWIRANPVLCELVGRRLENLVGTGWVSTLAAETRNQAYTEWQRAITQKRDFEMLLTFRAIDGSALDCNVRAQRLSDYRGETLGYVGTVVEVEDDREERRAQA